MDRLIEEARRIAPRSRSRYSGEPAGAAVLLSDGAVVIGVRVESASFSLTIPAVLNAVTTCYALGRSDIVAVACSRPLTPLDVLCVQGRGGESLLSRWEYVLSRNVEDLPVPREGLLMPLVSGTAEIDAVRAVADRAFVPASGFHVGALLEVEGGYIPGVNVENEAWSLILCAERNALGTAISYGFTPGARLWLTCDNRRCTPCGACRQLLAEHAPETTLLMDRGEAPPEPATPAALLPGCFDGRDLLQKA